MMLDNICEGRAQARSRRGLVFDAERNKTSMSVIRENNSLQAMRPEDADAPRFANVNTQLISIGSTIAPALGAVGSYAGSSAKAV